MPLAASEATPATQATLFAGRVFGPDLPGTGADAQACWRDDGALIVRVVSVAGSECLELVALAPAVDASGFNAERVRVSWRREASAANADAPATPGDHDYAFFVEGEAARAACLAGAPEVHSAALRGALVAQRRTDRRFRFGWGLLAALVLLPFIALGVFAYNADPLARWVVGHIPAEQEALLGDLTLQQARAQMRLYERGPAVDAVRSIGEKLTAGSPHRYRWFVADRPDLNAFAAPGGVVVVYSGLIRAAKTPEELAGVLAHEVAHAELRHSLQAMAKSLGLRALVSLAFGDVAGASVADAIAQLGELKYSRDAERDADAEGLRRLLAAGIDPQGMLRIFATLARGEDGAADAKDSPGKASDVPRRSAPPAFLSTHPPTEERLAALRESVAATHGSYTPLAVDWPAVQASLPR